MRPLIPRRFVDALNIGLIVASCALAHAFPYYLLLFSYAVLGPAHYLTQISWLHDRGYFTEARWIAPLFVLLSILLVLMFFHAGPYQAMACGAIFVVALGAAAYFIAPAPMAGWRAAIFLIAALLMGLALWSPVTALFLAVMVPTVLHVFVFTAAFMWAGALKTRGVAAWLALGAFFACAVSFFIPGLSAETMPEHPGLVFFRPVVAFMQERLGFSGSGETQLFGFLSFAYTYHYLNWFSKAEVIHWDKIPPARMKNILLIYGLTLAVYFYNYVIGVLLILFLAHLHVLLEFPLNMRTFAALARRKA